MKEEENTSLKYSLKSKEFTKKRLNIFNPNDRRSRSRSASLSPSKNTKNNHQNNVTKQYAIKVNPPSVEHSVVDKFN